MKVNYRSSFPNPVNPKTSIEFINYEMKLCEAKKVSEKNFLFKYLVSSFEKVANFSLLCTYHPVKKLHILLYLQ